MKQMQRPKKRSNIVMHNREDLGRGYFREIDREMMNEMNVFGENISANMAPKDWRFIPNSKETQQENPEEADLSILDEETREIREKTNKLKGVLAMLRANNKKSNRANLLPFIPFNFKGNSQKRRAS